MAKKYPKTYKAGKGRRTDKIEVGKKTLTLYADGAFGMGNIGTTYHLYDGEYEYFKRILRENPEVYGGSYRLKVH